LEGPNGGFETDILSLVFDKTGISISVEYDNNLYIKYPGQKIQSIKYSTEDEANLAAKNFAFKILNKCKL